MLQLHWQKKHSNNNEANEKAEGKNRQNNQKNDPNTREPDKKTDNDKRVGKNFRKSQEKNPDWDYSTWPSCGKEFTNAIARKLAALLGFKETKDFMFKTYNELVFKNCNKYITLDRTAHKGGVWKLFIGVERQGTYDHFLKNKIGK